MFILLILFSFLILSCQSSGSATPAPSVWVNNWLTTPTCQPPCWENITPGSTPITATIGNLSPNPEVIDLQGPETSFDGMKRVSWNFKSGGSGLIIANSQDITSEIILPVPQELTVKEVVTIYGFPTHVLLKQSSETLDYYTHLIYLPSGMLLELFLPGIGEYKALVDVSPDVVVGSIEFFPPGSDGYVAAIGANDPTVLKSMVPWQGYTVYPYLSP